MGATLFTLAGLGVAGLGAPLWLRKVRPNRVYGVRTAATFASEERWYATNASAGGTMVGVGLLTAAASPGLSLLGVEGEAHTLVMAGVLAAGGAMVTWAGLRGGQAR